MTNTFPHGYALLIGVGDLSPPPAPSPLPIDGSGSVIEEHYATTS